MESNENRIPIEVELNEGETYYWCKCGKSASQPFCDGSHQGSETEPVAYEAPRTKKVWLCVCKATKAIPYCDGSHKVI